MDDFPWAPTEDRVVVKPIDADSVSKGGVYIPDAAKDKPLRGMIIAAGPGKPFENGSRHDMVCSVGDEVLFGRYAGMEIKVPGYEGLLVMRGSEISLVKKR